MTGRRSFHANENARALQEAVKRGFGEGDIEKIEVVGDSVWGMKESLQRNPSGTERFFSILVVGGVVCCRFNMMS